MTLFETEFYTPRFTFRAHDDYVYSIAWTADGSRLVTVSGDTKEKLWDGRSTSASYRSTAEWRGR